MKFILSATGPTVDLESAATFACVELTRNKELSEPAEISREELFLRLSHGEEFRVLYRVGCRWEVGPNLVESTT